LNALRHAKKSRKKRRKGKLSPAASFRYACQAKLLMPTFEAMNLHVIFLSAMLSAWLPLAPAQTLTPAAAQPSDAAQLEALAKKIDEQNAKIDMLSQQILKLEQEMSNKRPGVIIGENAPSPAAAPVPTGSLPQIAGGSTHTVARGETLTSIAKLYKVGVEELQKFNHIEDGRRLQAGQTIMIPSSSPPTSTASPASSTGN
jgi:LysM repeat protein